MAQEENDIQQAVEKLYASVNFSFDNFDNIQFLIATHQLQDKGLIGHFDYDYQSETEVLKAVTCANITTPEDKHYSVKYDGELQITSE